ncbi:MAG: ABC transporter permease subunit [Desulfovibrionaceae bacterium]|jgi:NitT/TauT family transport system permease protein|nr:ABC transporter permease subunit [Desulfovibrionaceae bacterium]
MTCAPEPRAEGRARALGWRLAGAALFLGLWQAAALRFSDLVVASPRATWDALVELLTETDLCTAHLPVSALRMALGLGLGAGAGLLAGLAAGACPPLRRMLAPARWVLMSVPGVVIVMVAMLWLGMGTPMVVCLAGLVIAPTVYVAVLEGMDSVDPGLLEMAGVYRLPTAMRLRHVHLMSIAAPLAAALVVATGNSIRIVILAEVLGANQGLGRILAAARSNLETARIYALVLVSLGVVAFTELCLLRPLQRRVLRWRA